MEGVIDLGEVCEVYMENNGEISLVLKDDIDKVKK